MLHINKSLVIPVAISKGVYFKSFICAYFTCRCISLINKGTFKPVQLTSGNKNPH